MLALLGCMLLVSAEACSDGAVRLVGGPNEFEGRVEVCLDLDEDESEWGRWCADGSVRTEETNVVCRQLHGSGTQSIRVERSVLLYGRGDSSVAVTNVLCGQNNEDEITDCEYDVMDQLVDCDEVAVICSDVSCPTQPIRLFGGATSSEGLVDICTGSRFRAGLCYEEFTEDPEAAAVICTQLGYDASNPRVSESELRYSTRIVRYDCTGNEQSFGDCNLQETSQMTCSSARLSCQDFEATSSSPTPTTTDTGQPSSTSDTLVTIIVVVCVVLVLLLAGSVVIIIMMVLCTKRRRNNKAALQQPGIYEEMNAGNTGHVMRDTNIKDVNYESVDIFTEGNVADETAPQSIPTEGNVAYETAPQSIPTGGNVAYETAPQSIPTEGNVAYETAPQSIPTERNVAYETAPQSIPTERNVAYETAPQFIPTEGNVAPTQ